jgi:type IV pilus assembly protein PilW
MEPIGAIEMKRSLNHLNTSAFTLIELLIAMLISGFVMAAIYTAYVSQNNIYHEQETVANMQQNIRAAISLMARDIRLAGYDPTGDTGSGFVHNVNFSNGASLTETVKTEATQIAFTADLDGDGKIDQELEDINGDSNEDLTEMEQISFRLNGSNLQRYSTANGANEWQTIAEQIDQLEFRYLQADGTVTADPAKIRKVQISILAKSEFPDPKFPNKQTYTSASGTDWDVDDNFRRRLLITTVNCRN